MVPQAREDAACAPEEVVAEQELRAAEGAGQPCSPLSMPDSAAHMASPLRAAEASGAVRLHSGNRFPLDGWGPPFLLLRPRTGRRAAQRDGRKSARQKPASRSAHARQWSNPGEARAQVPKRACVLDADAAAGGADAAGAMHVKPAALLSHDAVRFLASGENRLTSMAVVLQRWGKRCVLALTSRRGTSTLCACAVAAGHCTNSGVAQTAMGSMTVCFVRQPAPAPCPDSCNDRGGAASPGQPAVQAASLPVCGGRALPTSSNVHDDLEPMHPGEGSAQGNASPLAEARPAGRDPPCAHAALHHGTLATVRTPNAPRINPSGAGGGGEDVCSGLADCIAGLQRFIAELSSSPAAGVQAAVQVHAASRGADLPEPAEQPGSHQRRHAPAESAAAGTPHHRNYARTRADDASTDAEDIRCQGALRWGPAPRREDVGHPARACAHGAAHANRVRCC